jgi:hypothetical protein
MIRPMRAHVGLLMAVLGIGLVAPWVLMKTKGDIGMSQMQQSVPQDGEPFMFGRWTPNPKGPNPLVPRVDRSTIGAYADLMGWDEFGIGRMQSGRLVSLEEWTRARTEVDPGVMVAGAPIESLPVQPGAMRLFMQAAPGVWNEVSADQTAGESLFIRLRTVPDLRTDAQVPVAEEIRQSLVRRNVYHYAADGRLIAITREERDSSFAPRRITIGPDGAPLD